MYKLYFGDNLHILREHIKDEAVDLIYLNPPFNSKRDYSVLFKTPKGHESDAQITAFEVPKSRSDGVPAAQGGAKRNPGFAIAN